MSVNIREARPDDCEQIMELVKELAVFEKMPEQVKIDAEVLRRDGFGEEKFFHSLVAESTDAKKLIGYALYYFNYSTWDGRVLYMEDLYVTPKWRSQGIGTKMWKMVAKVALQKQCTRMQWVVLGWNSRAKDLYDKMGSMDITKKEEWHLYRMNHREIEEFANS